MTVTKGELEGMILRVLNVSPDKPGFYSEERLSDAIEEAMTMIGTEILMADEGWLTTIEELDTFSGQKKAPIPPDCVMLNQVRYRVGDTFLPLYYDTELNKQQVATDSSIEQFPSRYRIIDNNIYFNPDLAVAGKAYLQLECIKYPQTLASDNDALPPQFTKDMIQLMKYAAASAARATHEDGAPPWAARETYWFQKIINVINKRNRQPTFKREFEGV